MLAALKNLHSDQPGARLLLLMEQHRIKQRKLCWVCKHAACLTSSMCVECIPEHGYLKPQELQAGSSVVPHHHSSQKTLVYVCCRESPQAGRVPLVACVHVALPLSCCPCLAWPAHNTIQHQRHHAQSLMFSSIGSHAQGFTRRESAPLRCNKDFHIGICASKLLCVSSQSFTASACCKK